MTLREAFQQGLAEMRAAIVPSPAFTVELLLCHVLGVDRAWLYAHADAAVDPAALDRYQELLRRRAAGTPTQYLTGHQEFWGLDFEVTPDVLIPRPETEHVVEVALERIRRRGPAAASAPLRIADAGTGSGCLAIALAHELPLARVHATDVSAKALAVARRNAARHGVATRIEFVEADLLAPFPPASFDLIVSNPPYVARAESPTLPVEVRDYEPASALYGGETGLEIYPRLIAQAAQRLVPGGVLVVELGYGESERVESLFDTADWIDIAITNDLAGIPRVLAAALASALPSARREATLGAAPL